jgi:hypothetical protein
MEEVGSANLRILFSAWKLSLKLGRRKKLWKEDDDDHTPRHTGDGEYVRMCMYGEYVRTYVILRPVGIDDEAVGQGVRRYVFLRGMRTYVYDPPSCRY